MSLDKQLEQLHQGRGLSAEQMESAIATMIDGDVDEQIMADFLICLREKGESVDELVGAARAMRSRMTPIRSSHPQLVDTCGTGGDGSGTFNISTAAAIVVAASGIPVAKHGNRAVSSRSGSADALRELGVNVDAPLESVEKCLDEIGLCFCYAPLFHQSVKNVASVRKNLAVPTIFNMLGPLCNPAEAQFQMVGVGKPWQRQLIAEALQKLGTHAAIVVHGEDGICEVSNADRTAVSIVNQQSIQEEFWSPEDFGIARTRRQEIEADNPQQSAELISQAISGEKNAARDIVVLNAAAAISLTEPSSTLADCAGRCAELIDTGQVRKKLEALAACCRTNS